MINVEDMPKSGYLIVTVYFRGYTESMQNDSRRSLQSALPNFIMKKCGIKIVANQFSLIRRVSDTLKQRNDERFTIRNTRAKGAQLIYWYENLTADKIRNVFKYINEYCKQRNAWQNYEIMFATWIRGV